MARIDPRGLQSPVWSPDGTMIVASYVIMPMPDSIFSDFRDEIVMIDPDTGKVTSFLQTGQTLQLTAQSWSADSRRFAMYIDSGPVENSLYTYGIHDPHPAYLSEDGALSPDWRRLALFRGGNIRILDISTGHYLQKYAVPAEGSWYVNAWSPNMMQLALVHAANQLDPMSSIWLLDIQSGVFSQFSPDSNSTNAVPAFSPTGRLLAYRTSNFADSRPEHKVVLARLDGSCKWTVPVDGIYDFTWSPDGERMFMIGSDGAYLADLKTLFGASISSEKGCP